MKSYLFPGQGSQFQGMGRELFDAFPDYERQASEVLGYSIRQLCLEDSRHQLGLTQFTQPALFTVNALTYLRKTSDGAQRPDFLAGHSLGEFDALWAAGVFDFPTGLRLVARRGDLMSQVRGGGMAAILGLTPHRVRQELQQPALAELDIGNFNSYEQTVISGPKEAIERAVPLFESAGARAIPLNVSAPFHSRYMLETQRAFAVELDALTLAPPSIPVIANFTALPHTPENLREHLSLQIANPVRWIETIEYLLRQGVSEFEEIGPGNVLTKLVRQIRGRTAFAG
jgi:trans-AT polyketide synthase, acyltransferase and oxidoreductase domains